MTEDEWLTGTHTSALLRHFESRETERPVARRLYLVGCACCRRIWDELDERCRETVAVVERYADEMATDEELLRASEWACDTEGGKIWFAGDNRLNAVASISGRRRLPHEELRHYVCKTAIAVALHQIQLAAFDAELRRYSIPADPLTLEEWCQQEEAVAAKCREEEAQLALIRDTFGNPFRPVALDPNWLTDDVLALATGIYADRAFDRMPILADALQDAGCDNEDTLNHCRDMNRPHARGCWVLDLLLGNDGPSV